MSAVLGIAEHNGWAEFVVVGANGAAPIVLSRQRIRLVDRELPSQPYHHEALEMTLADAEVLIERVTQSVVQHCHAALSEVQSRYSVLAAVMQESPFSRFPETLAEVMRSWSITCAADGMMYRESLADAAVTLGMNVVRYPRKTDPIEHTADQLGVEATTVASLVAELGKPLGPPWRKEHRMAAAAALGVLAGYTDLRI